MFEKGAKELRDARGEGTARRQDRLPRCRSAQQIAVLAAMEKDKHPFFDALRDATIAGHARQSGIRRQLQQDRLEDGSASTTGSPGPAPFGWYDRNA